MINKNLLAIFGFIIFSILVNPGCNNTEPELTKPLPFSCDKYGIPADFTFRDFENSFDSTYYCSLVYLDSVYALSDQTREHFPCFAAEHFLYKSEDGEKIYLDIKNGEHYMGTFGFSSMHKCLDNSNKVYYIGMDYEKIGYQIHNPIFFSNLKVYASVGPVAPYSLNPVTRQTFSISSSKPNGQYITYIQHFRAEIDKDGIIIDDKLEFFPEKELLGKIFKDVYTYNSTDIGAIEIFYNKSEGIVGFTDKNGKLWRLDE